MKKIILLMMITTIAQGQTREEYLRRFEASRAEQHAIQEYKEQQRFQAIIQNPGSPYDVPIYSAPKSYRDPRLDQIDAEGKLGKY